MTPRRQGNDSFAQGFDALVANIEHVIRGKTDVLRLVLTCLFAEGHLLIEDVPGVGKTSIARAISVSLDAGWNRIQFTPDLLPADVTGVSIYNQSKNAFEFHPGPVFANIVLGDEINRASPKTQSALLEVMEEHRVTVDGQPHPVPRPFMVIATQNPIDMDGTYRLPEAQLDRFLMRISVGYPDLASEVEVIETQGRGVSVDGLSPVLSADEVASMIATASSVHVAPAIQRYVAEVVAATRSVPDIRLGASPRGGIALVRAARALAAADGRNFITPDDVKILAVPVLAHRLILSPEAELQGRSPGAVLQQVLQTVPVPQALAEA